MIADMKKVTVYHNGRIFGRMRLCHLIPPRPFRAMCGQV